MNESDAKQAAVLSGVPPRLKGSALNRQLTLGGLFKSLYNGNPFYLISAFFILYAQTIIFDTTNIWMETVIPVGLIAAYTVLLTATAIFIVKNGSVWDDARSILLIILSLILVLSVSLDAKTLDSRLTGAAWLIGGFCFSIIIAETLRKWLQLSLPFLFRAVFYAMIGIFFAYPFVMSQLISGFPDSQLPAIRGIMLFPVICGLALLPLIPLIRRGPSFLAGNGTPWKWPMYPWLIFGLLTIGACFRTYLLSISFYGARGYGPYSRLDTGFGFYMLIPLVLTSMILLLEFSLESGQRQQIIRSMAAPVLLFLLASSMPTKANSELYHKFLAAAVGSNGSPMLIASAGALIFYVYGWCRSVKHSDIIVCAVLLLSLPIDARSQFMANSHIPSWILGLAGLGILAWMAIRENSTVKWMALVLGALMVAGTVFRNTLFTAWHCAIPVHIALASAMLLGFLRNDRFAVALRYASGIAMSLLFVTVLFSGERLTRDLPKLIPQIYLAAIFFTIMLYCFWYRKTFFFVMGGFNILILLLFTVIKGYNAVKATELRALRTIFWGLACFAVAFVISSFKGNLLQNVFLKLKARWKENGS